MALRKRLRGALRNREFLVVLRGAARSVALREPLALRFAEPCHFLVEIGGARQECGFSEPFKTRDSLDEGLMNCSFFGNRAAVCCLRRDCIDLKRRYISHARRLGVASYLPFFAFGCS